MTRHTVSLRRSIARVATATGLVTLLATAGFAGPFPTLRVQPAAAQAAGSSGCSLANGIQHVIYIQFDNTHLTRDRPNVPSDLEQMPHLLSFIQNNGVMLANHRTPLISHTSIDILTSLTGVYPDRHGVAVGQNSYQYYDASGSPKSFTTAFTYWTDKIGNNTYNMLSGAPTTSNPSGTNAPAPWVPYTRAGCDVGAVASANQVLENNNVNSKFGANDIATVFGANSPEAQEPAAQRTSDFVGIAVHCSQADSDTTGRCSSANNGPGRPDVLPDEPGGYTGFNALYGHKYVTRVIGPVRNLNDGTTLTGFPGFDGMNAANSLGYVAAMQEHGIPVTFAYISDVHDLQGAPTHTALGPGERQYVAQLKAYDDAFAGFFQNLQAHGINNSNTLFVFTADENDHFAGGPPLNPRCTGATIDNATTPPTVIPGNYCVYDKTPSSTPPGPPFGEVAAGLQGLLYNQTGLTSPAFTVGNDTAPGVYLQGQPARDSSTARTFEQDTGSLIVTDPLNNATESLAQNMADPVEMKILHMVTADPARTPTFTLFAQPDFYVTGTCTGGFNSDPTPVYTPACVLEEPAFAWLHGNVQRDITNTWLGMVGPGVRNLGLDNTIWSDHTDIRPTMLTLLGLQDDYRHDGRALVEILRPNVLPQALEAHYEAWLRLAQVYKQLNAPLGQFGLATLDASTKALESRSPGDNTYTFIENRLENLGLQRDGLAATIAAELDASTFGGQPLNEEYATNQFDQAEGFIFDALNLAQS